jgi:hypothetical protein
MRCRDRAYVLTYVRRYVCTCVYTYVCAFVYTCVCTYDSVASIRFLASCIIHVCLTDRFRIGSFHVYIHTCMYTFPRTPPVRPPARLSACLYCRYLGSLVLGARLRPRTVLYRIPLPWQAVCDRVCWIAACMYRYPDVVLVVSCTIGLVQYPRGTVYCMTV